MSEVFPLRLDSIPDIRLIACDLDGTLLDDDSAIHDDFWPLIDALHARGIVFCPASGRQYYSLLERFDAIADELIFIAENGCYVVEKGVEISSDCLDLPTARELVGVYHQLVRTVPDLGFVLCGKRSAYCERGACGDNPSFIAEVDKYYRRLQFVDDLRSVDDEILKVALFTRGSSEASIYPALSAYHASHQVVISGQNWVDVMVANANKGNGIRRIQQSLGIGREQTMAFGDFLNDLEMMDAAAYSFAMANAHPLLKERARYLSPGNAANGVVRTIKSVLQLD